MVESLAQKIGRQLVRESQDLTLNDGSRIAVVGGGPAGSLFTYFVLQMAKTVGIEVQVDLYEARHFNHRGPAGCNHCGGIISESLVQMLATEGINLPSNVVQRGVDSYTLHLGVGSVGIETPLQERRIAAVYRGHGPRDSDLIDSVGFDRYLQDLAANSGARVIRRLVSGVKNDCGAVRVLYPDGASDRYELVVLATGVNSNFLQRIQGLEVRYHPPKTSKAFICEFYLGRSTIEETLGASLHVFLLDLPRLEFGALIPKGDFATMVLAGEGIDEELVHSFLAAPEVRHCFPETLVPPPVCHCFPRHNVQSAARPFTDRLVMIGDAATTRLYKDGIGAAYRTAKAAARTVVFHGVSSTDFQEHYWPTCRRIKFDNHIGELVFAVTRLVQKVRLFRRGLLHMTAAEQGRAAGPKRMSTVLWDVFTGSAPYKEILFRTFHPRFIAGLIWHLLAGNWPLRKNQNNGGNVPKDWRADNPSINK
jgi:flavin-dependent dehydrogenase